MRKVERDPGRIQDMLEAADYILSFVEGVTYEQFLGDKIRKSCGKLPLMMSLN